MIECIADINALGNALNHTKDEGIIMVDVKEDINRIEYDLDATMREVKDLKHDLEKLTSSEKEDYNYLIRESVGTDNYVHNLSCRVTDLEGLMWAVIHRLDELLPKKKIDVDAFKYFADASEDEE